MYAVVLMAIAYWLGEGPAAVAFVMGLFSFQYFFIPPTHHFWPPGSTPNTWGMYAGFFLSTAVVGTAMALIRRSQRRTRCLALQLRESRDVIERQLALLQQALVPPPPALCSGYSTSALYLPASPGSQIGGDFYDVFRTEDGSIGLLIGDVSGKGIEAAALAAAARGTIRSFAYEFPSPGTALSHASSVLQSQESESGRFVTAFLGIVEPQTGKLCYARAGHPPAAIRRASGSVEFLACGGVPVGVFGGQNYQTEVAHLSVGDRLVLYSDGIMEARRGTELFEVWGIEAALVAYGSGAVSEMVAGLLTAAREWTGGEFHDDISVLAVEREA